MTKKNRFLDKFDNIDTDFIKDAEMKNNHDPESAQEPVQPKKKRGRPRKEEVKKGHIHIYSIPQSWIDRLKSKGYNISRFCKFAIEEKMREEGLI